MTSILADLIPSPYALARMIIEQDPEEAYRQSYAVLAADCDCSVGDLTRGERAAEERQCDRARKRAWLHVARLMEVVWAGQDDNIFAGAAGEGPFVQRYRVRYDVLGEAIVFETYTPDSQASRAKAAGLAIQRMAPATADLTRRRVLDHDIRLVVGEHAILSEPWWTKGRGPFGRQQ